MHMMLDGLGHALLMAVGMAWQTGWSLVLGFVISAVLQTVVSTDQMRQAFGRAGLRGDRLGHPRGSGELKLLLRVGLDHADAVQEGRGARDLAGCPARLHQPGPGTRSHPLHPAWLAIHAGRVDRRPRHGRADEPRRSGDLSGDLIVLPLLDVYRRYFGWRMAAYLAAVLFATMVVAALVVDIGFTVLDLVPTPNPNVRAAMTTFSLNYTFWLNVGFGLVVAYLVRVSARHPMRHDHSHDRADRPS